MDMRASPAPPSVALPAVDPLSQEELLARWLDSKLRMRGKTAETAALDDWYAAAAEVTRDVLLPDWQARKKTWNQAGAKRAYYLSMEYLPGPHMFAALHSAGLYDSMSAALTKLGQDPETVFRHERDPAIGNGGLGRLAACFADSAAALDLPILFYGLFYHNGFLKQKINASGQQEELPDHWLIDGQNPWGVIRNDRRYQVEFFGGDDGQAAVRVPVIAHDIMIPGYGQRGGNTLRLWNVDGEVHTGNGHTDALVRGINDRLYPPDDNPFGQTLRLMQEFLFTSASVQDIVDRHVRHHKKSVASLPETAAIQLNDTHPAIAIPELMLTLMERHGTGWAQAKQITSAVCSYTNHTLASEALETWPVDMFRTVLPRHYAVIERLQTDLMQEVDHQGRQSGLTQRAIWDRQSRVSIIHEGRVHMARLAAYYADHVNGVARMHSELVSETLFPDLADLRKPADNRTNGVAPRRWLVEANPDLAALLTETLGDKHWVTQLERLDVGLESLQRDPASRAQFRIIKRNNKQRLAALITAQGGPAISPDALIDVQGKRFHAYKRQFLKTLDAGMLYEDILENPDKPRPDTVILFGGKAAPTYAEAKDNITVTNRLARIINNDPRIGGKLKLVFVENYNVSNAQIIIPAADISEQISTAGWEASGTSNMKLGLNGALTVGTLDGANVEIRERVGPENFFLFGHNKEQLDKLDANGYNPMHFIDGGSEAGGRLRRALEFMEKNLGPEGGRLAHNVWVGDRWKIAADMAGDPQTGVAGYWDTQAKARALYFNDPEAWLDKSIANVQGCSHFSSDKTLLEYAQDTWHIEPQRPLARAAVSGRHPAA